MKFFKWFLIAVVALAVLLVGGGLALPSKFKVERTALINAPAEKVYGLVADPRAWPKWGVWNQRDPNMKMTFSGAASGQGAKWSWESKSEGSGAMEFTRVEPGKLVEYSLSFPDMGMNSRGALTMSAEGGGTRISWTNEGDVGGNPLMHWMTLMMDRMVGPDFEKGLANLKALAEKT
jgi:uncharacterized protein YndB with AHSA1/START domain